MKEIVESLLTSDQEDCTLFFMNQHKETKASEVDDDKDGIIDDPTLE